MICYDSKESYQFWKEELANKDEMNICHFKEDGNECMRIIAQIINLNKVKVKKNLYKYLSLKNNNIGTLFSDINFDSKYVCFDILFTEINTYYENYDLFTKLNFNLAIYDTPKSDFLDYPKLFDINKQVKKIFFTYIPQNEKISSVNIHNFFNLIYFPFVIIDKNLIIFNNGYDSEIIKFYNKKDVETNYKILYKKFGWDIFMINKIPVEISNYLTISKVIESYTESHILFNFVSISPSNEDIKTYFEILLNKKEVLFILK